MANLAAKLGQTILTKTKEGISDFGQGMKGAFISANPAVFGPAAQYLEKKLTKDTKDQKKEKTEDTRRDKEKEQRSQGFFEENFLEDRKMQQDTLSNIVGINKNTASIDRTAKEILELLKKCCDCKCDDSLLPKITDLLKGGLGAIAGAIAALSTARLAVPTAPPPTFPSVKIPVPGAATPISTPVASPVATPVASPVSTTAPFSTTSQVSSVIENTIVRNVSGLLEGVRPSITNVAGSLENFNTRVNLLTDYYNSVIESAVRLKISNDYAVERVNSVSETSGRLSSSLAEVPERVTRLASAIETGSSEIIKLGNATTESVLKITNQTNFFTEQLNTVLRNLERVPAMIEANYTGQGASGSAGAGGPRIGGPTSSVTPVVPPMRLGGGGGGTGAPALGYSGGGQPPGTSVALTGDPGRFTGAAPYRGPGIGPGPVTDIWLSPMDRIKYGLGVTSEFIKNNFGAATESIKSGFGAVTTAVSSGYGQFSSAAQDVENKIFGGKFGVGLAALGTGAAFIEGLIDEKALAEALQIDESQITGRDRLYGAMGTIVGRTAAVPFDLATAALKGGATIADYYTGYDFRKQLDENISVGDIGKASSVGWTRIIGAIGGIGPERFKQERPLGNTPWTSSSWGADVLSKAFLKEDYEKTHGVYAIPPIDSYVGGGPGFNTTMPPTNVSDVKGREGWMRVYQLAAAAGDKYPEITASQWAQETGWGKKIPTDSNNIFGIKARPGEPFVESQTFEYDYQQQKNVSETARFKKYGSVEEAVADRVNRWSPRYASAQNVEQAVQMLVKTGYATDPNYGNAIRSIIAQQTSLGLPSIDSSPRVTAAKAEEQLKTTVQIADATQSTSKTQESALGELRQSVQLSYDQIRQQELTRIQAQDDARRQFEEYRKTEDEKRKRLEGYENERRRLQQQFDSQMQGIFRPMVDALKGPNNVPEATVNAGKNLSKFLKDDFTKLGVTIFGKQYGAAIGGTFQELAGVYMNEFVNEALAPALGMKSETLNRAINTYVKGVELIDPQLKQVNESLAKSKAALEKYTKETKGISTADIVRAAGKGGFSAEQQQKIAQLTALREDVKQKEAAAAALRSQKKQYKNAALEDMIFGMTGISLGPRTMLDQYAGGAEGLTKDLASFFGAPFNPAFGLNDKDALAYKKLEAESKLYQGHVQGQANVMTNGVNGMGQVLSSGASQMHDAIRAAMSDGAGYVRDAVASAPLGSANGSWDVPGTITSAVKEGVSSAFDETTPFGLANMDPAGGGTSIPGYVDDGSYDRVEAARFARQTSSMGPSATGWQAGASRSATGGRLMDFGQNMLYNMLGSKVSSAFGGGITGNIFGKAAQGALKGAFSGGDIVQNIGAQFGMKLAPGAGIGDLIGGVSSMFTNQITSMGSMFTNLATSKLMPGFMSQGVMDFGTGMQAASQGLSGLTGAFQSGNLSHMAGAAGGALMAGMQGYGISKALSGGYSTGGNTVNAIAGIASAFMGPVAGVIGGLVNRAFGRKAKETKAQGFSGTFSTEGADIKQFTDWFQKGGWLRSDKKGTDFKAVDSETAKAFSDTVKDTTKTVEALAKSLGYDPTKTKGFSKAIKIDLKGLNEKQQQEAIQKAFKDYGASLVGASFKTVGKFTKEGEDQLDTLSRLANASQLFKSVMTGPDVKKILGLDNADTIKNLVTKQFAGVTNMDAAIKDYMAGGKGMMETVLGGIGIPKPVGGGADSTIGWLQPDFMRRLIGGLTGRSYASVDSDGGMTAALPAELSTAFSNVFSKLNLDPVSDVAQNIVSAFTGSLQDQAGSLKEYLDTYVANFQSELIKAYGGEEEFQKVESSLFDLLYTDEEKRIKLQELTAAQMKEAAQNLKDAGVAIDPDKLGATFADNQKAAKDMLTAADKDLASGKITKEQYATIRKSAADFLTAAKKNTELSKDGKTTGTDATRKPVTADDVRKMMYPVQTTIEHGTENITASAQQAANSIATTTQTAIATGTSAIATSSSESVTSIIDKITLGQTTLEQAITSGIIRVTDSSANGVQKIITEVASGKTTLTDAFASGALTISTTSASGANTISTSATSQAQVLERLITDFINSSGTFANAVNGLNGSIGTLENAVSNFDFGGAGTGDGGASAAAAGDDGSASDGGAGGGADGGSTGEGSGGVGGGGVGVGGGDGSGGGGAGDGSAWAKGGWFRKRRPMIVGEVGPEVMVPDFAGTIVPTHKIIEAVQNAAALDSQTRNLLLNAAPAPNPVSVVYLDQENANKSLNKERSMAQNVNNAVVDNSVTQVSSPQTTVINGSGDVRSSHPISGMFTRNMIGARGF